MSAAFSTIEEPEMNELSRALRTLHAARTHHHDATAALARARQVHQDVESEAARLSTDEDRWLERHSKKLADWIAAGSKGTPPAIAADAKAQQALSTARASLSASTKALASFEAAERDARKRLADAEAAAKAVALSILAAEGDSLAQTIIDRDTESDAMRQKLVGLRALVDPSPLVRRAAWMPSDWVHTPLNELRELEAAGGRHTPRAHVPLNKLGRDEVAPEAIEHWQRRLDALLAEVTASSAERAA
jgi:hypothetical protein